MAKKQFTMRVEEEQLGKWTVAAEREKRVLSDWIRVTLDEAAGGRRKIEDSGMVDEADAGVGKPSTSAVGLAAQPSSKYKYEYHPRPGSKCPALPKPGQKCFLCGKEHEE